MPCFLLCRLCCRTVTPSPATPTSPSITGITFVLVVVQSVSSPQQGADGQHHQENRVELHVGGITGADDEPRAAESQQCTGAVPRATEGELWPDEAAEDLTGKREPAATHRYDVTAG